MRWERAIVGDAKASGTAPAFRTRTERHEVKYVIDPRVAVRIRDYLRPYTESDPFSVARGISAYPICSLYFDSPKLSFFNSTLSGDRDRVKLRIRCYAPECSARPDLPAFVEIKRKTDGLVRKRRVMIGPGLSESLLLGCAPPTQAVRQALHGDGAVVDEFCRMCSFGGLHPVAYVRYEREAYESRFGDYVRITFDRALQAASAHPNTLGSPLFCPVPVNGVIFEIKFTNTYPRWVANLIRRFDLSRQSVPKYVMSLRAFDGAEHVAAGKGPHRVCMVSA